MGSLSKAHLAAVAAGAAAASLYLASARYPVLHGLCRRSPCRETPWVEKNSVVLLTGATCPAGMGSQIALTYHDRLKQGGKLILVGYQSLTELLAEYSSEDEMASRMRALIQAPSTLYLQVDLTLPDCGEKLAAGLRAHLFDRVDVLVQLAGIGYLGPLLKQSEENVRKIVNCNLRAAVLCTKHVLPFMNVKRGAAASGGKTAKCVFVSSIVSQKPTPAFSVYTASKAAVDHFAWSLCTEMEDSNVAVQLLHPAATRTRFHKNAGVPDGAFDRSQFMSPEQMASLLVRHIDHSGDFRSTFGRLEEQAGFYSGWLLPQQWWRAWKLRSFGRQGYNPPTVEPASGERQRRCVITGASSGIGFALAEAAPPHHEVVCINRTAGGFCAGRTLRQVDLSMESGLLPALEQALGREPVDVLINNAGVNHSGRLCFLSDHQIQQLVAVNVVAPILLTIAALRLNAEAGHGAPALCFVSSASHFFGYPGSSVYGACKDAVASFAKSLGYAMCGQGCVLTVFPGPTRTPQAKANSPCLTDEEDEARAKNRMDPAQTARETWEALRRGQACLVPGKAVGAMAARASRDPAWATEMMKKTQLAPLVAKHAAINGGDAGL